MIERGRAFTLGREAVYAIDTATGDVVWEAPRVGPQLSSPAIVDGTPPLLLFVDGVDTVPTASSTPSTPSPTASEVASATTSPSGTTEDAIGGSVVALDATTGEEVWTAPLSAASRTGVTVSGSTALVGQQDGTVVALDVASGDVRWTREVGARVEIPLAADDDTVIALAEDADGREITIAALELGTGERRFAPLVSRIGSSAAPAPTLVGGQAVVGMPDRLVHAIALEDGAERWASLTLTAFSPATGLAAADGQVYATDLGGGVYALDGASGDRRWSFQLNDLIVRSAPVRVGGYVLVGVGDGRLVAIDTATGHLAWQARAPGLTGAIAVGIDVVIAVEGGRDAGLIAYEHDPTGTLVDVTSPAELELATTLATAGLGALIALLITLGPGMLLRRRFGTRSDGADADGGVADPVGDGDDEDGRT